MCSSSFAPWPVVVIAVLNQIEQRLRWSFMNWCNDLSGCSIVYIERSGASAQGWRFIPSASSCALSREGDADRKEKVLFPSIVIQYMMHYF